MSKRFQAPKEFMRQAKIPKLDININSRRSNLPHQATECDNELNNLWDDSDDDVLLLATQVAEKQQTSRFDLTFSEFAPGAHAQTSTQRLIAESKHLFEDADDEAFNNLELPGCSTAAQAPASAAAEQEHNADYLRSQAQSAARCQMATENQLHSVTKHLTDLQAENLRLNNELLVSKEKMQSKMGETALLRDELRHTKQQLQNMKMQKILSAEAAKTQCESKIVELTRKIETRETQLQMKSAECASLKIRHADESRRLEESQFLTQQPLLNDTIKTSPDAAAAETGANIEATETTVETDDTNHFKVDFSFESITQQRHAPQCIFEITTEYGELQRERNLMTKELERLQLFLAQLSIGKLPREQAENMTEMLLISATKVFKEFSNYVCSLTYAKNIKYYPAIEHHISQYESQQSNQTNFIEDGSEWIDIQRMRKQLRQQAEHKANQAANVECIVLRAELAASCALNNANLADLSCIMPDDEAFETYQNAAAAKQWIDSKRLLESPANKVQSRKSLTRKRTLLQPNELFRNERAVTLRRYVAAVTLSCTFLPELAKKIINQKHEQRFLLQIVSDAINKLSYALEICEHQCLLEAFAALLHMLLEQDITLDADNVTCLADLLKQLVFSRPNAWVLLEVTAVCIVAMEHWPEIIDKLCVNSVDTIYIADRTRSICRFRNDSCVLQVFAGLLEATFDMHKMLPAQHFKLLTAICQQHVNFVFSCFHALPEFLRKLLGFYENTPTNSPTAAEFLCDEDKQSNDSSKLMASETSLNDMDVYDESSTTAQAIEAAVRAVETAAEKDKKESNNAGADVKCACYVTICLSVVSLIYQMLYSWLRLERKFQNSEIIEISQVAVQLLHMIFCENYLTRLLIDGEVTTRHQLYMICKWWSEHSSVLKFNETHMFLLEKLQNSHVMPKSLEDEVNANKVSDDLNELNVTSKFNLDNLEIAICKNTAQQNIERRLADPKSLISLLKGYAFNFE